MKPYFHGPFSISRLAAGLAAVTALTLLLTRFFHANPSTAGFCFLLIVLAVAATSGFRVSALVSAAAMLCLNYFFLPPVGRFTIADPQNWVALITFLLTALVASHLSDRAQKQAANARLRQHETELLYSLSRAILLTEPARPIAVQAAESIARIFDSPTVVLLDAATGATFQGGPVDLPQIEARLHEAVRLGAHHRDPVLDVDIWPIALGGAPIGALAASGIRVSDGVVQSMLNLVAIALERVRTEQAASHAEAARQSEEFKSTLLDAIAHEFKTPLTSIKAAASGLQSVSPPLAADASELATIIEEESDRLAQLVSEAAKMAQIDAGKVTLHRAPTSAAALCHAAATTFAGRGADRIDTSTVPDTPLLADRDLIILALRQALDNALKYSGPSQPVVCSASLQGAQLLLRVADLGPGIPERDRDRVFDKFFRRAATRSSVPGSGLGLHIAREIARIHGGDLTVQPNSPSGAVFCFSLPLHHEVTP